MRRKTKILTQLITIGLLSSAVCFADVITGPFTITGTAMVSALSIAFNPDATVATNTPSDPSNPLVGSAVDLMPLTEATTPINETFPPLTDWLLTTTSIANPAAGDIALDLTFLPAGIDPQSDCTAAPAPGQTCTPAFPALVSPGNPLGLSNFNLQNTGSLAHPSFTASFNAIGTARDLDGGPNAVDNFTGSFTQTISGTFYQPVLAAIAAGKTMDFTYAGSFNFTPLYRRSQQA